jgi:L-fuconolactonase
MIGSDWPVCTLSGNYESVMNIVTNYLSNKSKEAILGDNCARFYQIPAEEQQ